MGKKHIAIIIVLVIVAVLSSIRLISLNSKYPSPSVDRYPVNHFAPYNQFELKITGSEFMDVNTVNEVFKEEISFGQDIKCIIVDLTVKNSGEQKKQIEIYNFILESLAWKNGINLAAFMQINEDNDNATLAPTLESGESLSLKLPFTMINDNFKQNQWSEVENRKYSLVYNLYPTKQIIDL